MALPTSMDRREFLAFRRRGRQRVLELSCERLYVRWVNAEARSARTDGDEIVPESGEPPTRIAAERCEDLFAELERRLADADVLRVVEEEWLDAAELRGRVQASVAVFERRGGRVERGAPTPAARGVP